MDSKAEIERLKKKVGELVQQHVERAAQLAAAPGDAPPSPPDASAS